MKFRKRSSIPVSAKAAPPAHTRGEPFASAPGDRESGNRAAGRGRWSTTLLVIGSALLGATAIAFWNRRTIADMRAQLQAGLQAGPVMPALSKPADPALSKWMDDDIF